SVVGCQAAGSSAHPGWVVGRDVGVLDATGATFALTSVRLGAGRTFLDVSSASAAQVAALTTAAGAGVTLGPANEIIVKDSVATTASATTFKNIAGFNLLGIGGPAGADGAGGTINMANLPATISGIEYITAASGAVSIKGQTNALTVDTFDNGAFQNLTVAGPAGLSDALTVRVGNQVHSTAGAIGTITVTGDEVFTLTAVGSAAGVNPVDLTGLITLTPTLPGGHQTVTISGDTTLRVGDTVAFQG